VKAAVLYEIGGPLVVEEVHLDRPGPGEVRVRIAASGVCRSDDHVVSGATKHPLPVVLGHEGAGRVVEVGAAVTRVKPGDAVVLDWAPDCGRCFYCLRGKPNLCETFVEPTWAGALLDGTTRLRSRGRAIHHFSAVSTFAEETVVPEESCVPIRPGVPLEAAALLGCCVTTGVGAVLRTARVRPGDSVAVFGCGGVGLNVIQGAALSGASPIVAVDLIAARREAALRFGATDVVGPGEDAVASVRAATGGRGADFAFEAVGNPEVQERALEAVRPAGSLVLVGLPPVGSRTSFPAASITRQEKTVLGSYYGSCDLRRDVPLFLDLYAAGNIRLDELISRRFRLEEIGEAFEALRRGEGIRGVVVFDRE
jgi:S-(hydroxymethyl)glutathione dehydrogenase/alcohol dehydrogenase